MFIVLSHKISKQFNEVSDHKNDFLSLILHNQDRFFKK